jgi:hypothetical protein
VEDSEKLKQFQAMVEVSRKWVTVMDAKAAFVSAMNAGLLAFIWAGAKLGDMPACRSASVTASVFSLFSLTAAVWIVMPRGTVPGIKPARQQTGPQPVSFYGYVAGFKNAQDFAEHGHQLSERELVDEALHQQWAISKVVKRKESVMIFAGRMLLLAVVTTGVALVQKVVG